MQRWKTELGWAAMVTGCALVVACGGSAELADSQGNQQGGAGPGGVATAPRASAPAAGTSPVGATSSSGGSSTSSSGGTSGRPGGSSGGSTSSSGGSSGTPPGPSCYADVASNGSIYKGPSVAHQGVCDATEIAMMVDACAGTQLNPAPCLAFQQAHPTCARCGIGLAPGEAVSLAATIPQPALRTDSATFRSPEGWACLGAVAGRSMQTGFDLGGCLRDQCSSCVDADQDACRKTAYSTGGRCEAFMDAWSKTDTSFQWDPANKKACHGPSNIQMTSEQHMHEMALIVTTTLCGP